MLSRCVCITAAKRELMHECSYGEANVKFLAIPPQFFDQTSVTCLAMPELALDRLKRTPYLRSAAVLELVQLVAQRMAGFGFVQRFAL